MLIGTFGFNDTVIGLDLMIGCWQPFKDRLLIPLQETESLFEGGCGSDDFATMCLSAGHK